MIFWLFRTLWISICWKVCRWVWFWSHNSFSDMIRSRCWICVVGIRISRILIFYDFFLRTNPGTRHFMTSLVTGRGCVSFTYRINSVCRVVFSNFESNNSRLVWYYRASCSHVTHNSFDLRIWYCSTSIRDGSYLIVSDEFDMKDFPCLFLRNPWRHRQ